MVKRDLALAEARNRLITKDEIKYMLSRFTNMPKDEKYKENIIRTFVSRAELYDDYIVVYYNLTDKNGILDYKKIELLNSSNEHTMVTRWRFELQTP